MDKQRALTKLEEIDRSINRLVDMRYRLVLAYNRSFPTDHLSQKTSFIPKGVVIHQKLTFMQPPKSRIKL